MPYNYSGSLDFDAQAWAKRTGVAFGWDQRDKREGEQRFYAGCEPCGFCTIHHWQGGSEDELEGRALIHLRTEAEQHGCPHVPAWDRLRDRGDPVGQDFREVVDGTAMLLALERMKEAME
jgi:hypothetical protein